MTSTDDLPSDIAQLRAQIHELQDSLEAIRSGGIDAVIVGEPGQEKVYTLTNADRPYRMILEQMQEGAAVVSKHGVILAVNPRLGEMLGRDAEALVGTDVEKLIVGDGSAAPRDLLALEPGQTLRAEYELAADGGAVPVLLAASGIDLEGTTVVSAVVTDLSAQKDVETRLRKSEHLLNRIIESLPVGVYICDRDGHSLYVNAEGFRLTGLSQLPETADGVRDALTMVEAGTGAPYPAERMPITRARNGEVVHLLDMELRSQSDGTIPVELWATPVLADDGTVDMAILAAADVSERKQAERTMAQQAQMLDLAHDAVIVWDADGRVTYWNTGAQTTYGYPREQAMGAIVHDLLRTRFRQPFEELQQILERGGQWEGELEQARADGSRVVVHTRWAPYLNLDGARLGTVEINRDITERKQAEERTARQAQMLDLAHDAVIVLDRDGRITYWNTGAETTYGFPRERAVGSIIHELLHTKYPEPLDVLQDKLARNGQWEGEFEQTRADGSHVIVNTRWAPFLDLTGVIVGTVEVNRDITERKTAEQVLAQRAAELEIANRDIQRSNDDLERFAYAASHDLSEPVRAIQLPLSMLERRYAGQLGPDADEYIGFAVDGCKRMQKMIDDLLRWSRVGRIEDKPTLVDCSAVVDEVLLDLHQAIKDANAIVTIGPLPTVWGVRAQLMQVFQNLISNSMKFVEPGGVPHVEVAAKRDGSFWRFTVTDNGIGVDPRHRERIFGMFKRLHPRDEYPGTGIGLALAKRSVERHGGAIGVEDTPSGQGSRFWFTIPAAEPSS